MALRSILGSDRLVAASALPVLSAWTFHLTLRGPTTPGPGDGSNPLWVNDGGWGVDFGFIWDHNNSAFRAAVYMKEGGGGYKSLPLSPPIGQWLEITGQYDGAGTLRAWLNGRAYSVAATAPPSVAGTVHLFNFVGGGAVTPGIAISRCAVWGDRLSDAEIAMLHAGDDADGLRMGAMLAHWRMDVPTGATDLSGRGRNLSVAAGSFAATQGPPEWRMRAALGRAASTPATATITAGTLALTASATAEWAASTASAGPSRRTRRGARRVYLPEQPSAVFHPSALPADLAPAAQPAWQEEDGEWLILA